MQTYPINLTYTANITLTNIILQADKGQTTLNIQQQYSYYIYTDTKHI